MVYGEEQVVIRNAGYSQERSPQHALSPDTWKKDEHFFNWRGDGLPERWNLCDSTAATKIFQENERLLYVEQREHEEIAQSEQSQQRPSDGGGSTI